MPNESGAVLDEFESDLENAACFLAASIGLEPEPDDRPALDELGDALLVSAGEEVVARLTAPAVEALWSSELEDGIREGLTARAASGGWADEPAAVLADLDARGKESLIAHAVVQHLAQNVGNEGLNPFFCVCCIDERIENAPPSEHRRIACEVAQIAIRDIEIGDDELGSAARGSPVSAFATALATDERREAVRVRLRRIARLGATSVPALARELDSVLDETLPADPVEDVLWLAFCDSLVERLEPAFN